jgi:hypothetical protein
MPKVIMVTAFARIENGRPVSYRAGQECEVEQSEIPRMMARGLIVLEHNTQADEALDESNTTSKPAARRGRPKGA